MSLQPAWHAPVADTAFTSVVVTIISRKSHSHRLFETKAIRHNNSTTHLHNDTPETGGCWGRRAVRSRQGDRAADQTAGQAGQGAGGPGWPPVQPQVPGQGRPRRGGGGAAAAGAAPPVIHRRPSMLPPIFPAAAAVALRRGQVQDGSDSGLPSMPVTGASG